MDKFLLILFYVTLIIQLIYFVRYFYPLSRFKSRKRTSVQPKVSVVICANNEEQNLKENLQSILNQQYSDFEVIIVDDRSVDKTYEVALSFKSELITLIRIDELEEGVSPKKNAITKGIEKASGEFVLLTDADCKPQEDSWIARMVDQIEDSTDIVLGYSPYQAKNGLLNKLIQFDTFFTAMQYLSFALKVEVLLLPLKMRKGFS